VLDGAADRVLEHFDAVGMRTLRQKSVALMNYFVS
jgi:kynureninase